MDKATFWQLIDEARQAAKGDNWRHATLLLEKLIALDEEEIIAFNFIFDEFMKQAYLADLWNAADIIGAGCSDDGFMDFRAWLIGQGEHVYEAALKDPEILVDVVEDGFDTQG